MRFIKSLAVILHTLLFLAIGGLLIVLSLNLLSADELTGAVNYVAGEAGAKTVAAIAGGLFIIIGLLIAQVGLGRLQGEKTIAFENPDGQVTVSLLAIEDFIRKTVHHLAEVKELRSSITANKKGINIVCRATIYSDSNIPETTERIQNIVKSKVHEMLGVEETINIKINVTKIALKEKGEVCHVSKTHNEASRHMPLGAGE